MSRFWSAVARELTPYTPGEQPKLPGLIKLNTNENPYPPSPRVLETLRVASNDTLRLYPDPGSDALRDEIAALHGVTRDQVFVGNGSDEVLAHVFHALLKHDAPILFPDVTYSFYPVYCGLYHIDYEIIPLDANFNLNIKDYFRPNGGVIFPNPNAPTGMALPLEKIDLLLQRNRDSVVVLDEAYVDFGAESAVSLVNDYDNVLIIRTLSKSYALAGLRVGYAVGNADLIDGLQRVKDSFNSYPLGRLAQVGALAAVQDQAYLSELCARIVQTRNILVSDLEHLGFEVLPSTANFVFACHPLYSGEQWGALLRERNIIVRHFKQPARIMPFIRITIGTATQCQTLIEALSVLIASSSIT
ncbi:MAG: histidinol-phosphate transaminase [Betaproteobacteria bacterium]|nr:histidinol-phosphate transaminase [Betaproteobacteria bacterium]